jgi:prepilin-type N-terminal cleavage/methylation domain-containing protein
MKKGFTIIEVLVVLAVIVLMAGVIFATLTTARIKARDGQRLAQARHLSIALEQFEISRGTYKAGESGPINGGPSSTLAVLKGAGMYSASTLLDPIYGVNNYYVGYCGEGSGYNIYLKVEQEILFSPDEAINNGCDGPAARALGYNYVLNASGSGGGTVSTSSLLDFFGTPVTAQTAAAGNVAYYTDSTHVTGGSALNWDALGAKLSVAGTIESTNGGIRFPDGTTQTTAVTANADRTERVMVGGGSGNASLPSVCTASPCTIYTQSGAWVTSVVRAGVGSYNINIAAGIFSLPPTCTYSSSFQNNGWSFTGSIHATGPTQLRLFTGSSGAQADTSFNIICVGPR